MASRKIPAPIENHPLRLLQPPNQIKERIEERVTKGKQLLDIPVANWEDLETKKNEYRKWNLFNEQLLKQVFSNDEMAVEYSGSGGYFAVVEFERSLSREIQETQDDIRKKIHRLESISERVEIIPLAELCQQLISSPTPAVHPTQRNRVFVVHGHDCEARESAARFIERLGLTAVVLHEQANEGMTIVEKLEKYSDVGFAVVLLTPDDEGRKAGTSDTLQLRARQNVILELGYFVGRLGRKNVCALYRDSVEIPSDFIGVLYVPLDLEGAWKFRLAKELKASGFEIDLNRL